MSAGGFRIESAGYPLSVPFLLAIFLSACGADEPDAITCTEGELLDGDECVPVACGTGTWGALQTDDDTIYVDALAEAGGDGSKDSPFNIIQEGLDAQGKNGMVAVAAGTYLENLQMSSDHSGVHLAGRCMDLVTIDGSEGSEEEITEGCGIYLDGRLTTTWTVSGLTVEGSPWVGISQGSGSLTLERTSVIENEDYGIETFYGTLVATDCTVQGNRKVGVNIHDSTVTLEGVRVLDTQPSLLGELGRGIDVVDSSTLTARNSLVQGNHEAGIMLDGSMASLSEVQVLDTQLDAAGEVGRAITLQSSSTLLATDCVLQNNREYGIYAIEDTSIELNEVQVLDTQPSALGVSGYGIGTTQQSTLVATATIVQGNHGIGVIVDDSAATLEEVQVLDTRPGLDGEYGRGINVQNAGTLVATDCLVQGSRDSGVFVDASTATLDSVQVLDTRRSAAVSTAVGLIAQLEATVNATDLQVHGTDGPGLYVASASLECTGCTLSENALAGAAILEGELILTDALIEGTIPDQSSGGGIGVLAVDDLVPYGLGAPSLTLRDSTVRDNDVNAVYLRGSGSYQLTGNDLHGGDGLTTGTGLWNHGDSLFVTKGQSAPTTWSEDEQLGLLVRDNLIA
ncbi:MAG: right-handed parallel beta-helix repeat-containing protein, partial [Myxococcota bacterium]|nr:right-handed parallel beta-helix repeat-containing protein [Myxococcota bacterium]